MPQSVSLPLKPVRRTIAGIIGPAIRSRSSWDSVSHSELGSLWNFEGTPVLVVLKRTAKAFIDDDLLSRAAELGFYFLFALFPMLICGSSVVGLAARSACRFYDRLLHSLAMVVPPSAYQLVIDTFNQTTQASTGGKAVLRLHCCALVRIRGLLLQFGGHTQPRLQGARDEAVLESTRSGGSGDDSACSHRDPSISQ